MKNVCFLLVLFLFSVACSKAGNKNSFVHVKNGQFIKDGKPYYYIGTNYWYGAILGSQGDAGDRERLIAELDFMKANGIDNLRVLAGAEGPNNEPWRVTPALQTAPGEYDAELLDGLDFFMAELGKRNMTAVLFLTNNWEWSGGFSQYVNWNGYGNIPYPKSEGNTGKDFKLYNAKFLQCDECKEMAKSHFRFMLQRTNKYTGLAYTKDPAVFSWEIANEPRSMVSENNDALVDFLFEMAGEIKSIDKNHMVTTGSEGVNLDVYEQVHSNKNIDYLTFHIWPKNWRWINSDAIAETLPEAIDKTNEYLDVRIEIARKLSKPIVFEEFGLPRDKHGFTPDSPTSLRDKYYTNAFEHVLKHFKSNDVLAGCNFWAFGGSARPVKGQVFWKEGDKLMGDPPQEEQGLNAVFDCDSTIGIIKQFNTTLGRINN